MAVYLFAMWIVYSIYGVIFLISLFVKNKKLHKFLENYSLLILIIGATLLIMALITKDPLNVAGITIPTEIQWLGSMLITGFGAWKFYLNPLKSKVYSMDREIGEVKTSVHKVESNVSMILNKLMKK